MTSDMALLIVLALKFSETPLIGVVDVTSNVILTSSCDVGVNVLPVDEKVPPKVIELFDPSVWFTVISLHETGPADPKFVWTAQPKLLNVNPLKLSVGSDVIKAARPGSAI